MGNVQALERNQPGVLPRWRARLYAHKRRRLVAPRKRRRLAQSLRRVANRPPTETRHTVLLHDRVAAVRHELLELAMMLERIVDPDPAWVGAIDKLLTDGCQSPLYNCEIHISELRATLYYLRGKQSADIA